MTEFPFYVKEHVIPCQHVRGYPRATAHEQEEVLHLAIKQYIPHDNPSPQVGDVTIIGAHAQGFPKELYEPLWAEIHDRVKSAGVSIRGIWIADVANQGASGVMNEFKLGNEPCAFDHARDLLHMVNAFRDQMVRPLVGIGHSMGGTMLVNLALLHPRLLESLVLIDPIIHRRIFADGYHRPALASARRRDLWPSRAAAAEDFAKNRLHRRWDPRVFDRWIEHGLRPLPTAVHPDAPAAPAPAVTLATTKHQEVFTFLRPTCDAFAFDDDDDDDHQKSAHADADADADTDADTAPFERPEPVVTFHMLPHVRPSVLYVFGEASHYTACEPTADKVGRTGTAVGDGLGGRRRRRRVAAVTLDGAGHLMPMEEVGRTAAPCAAWLAREAGARWRADETAERSAWACVPDEQKRVLAPRFVEMLQAAAGGPAAGAAGRREGRNAADAKL